MDAFPISSDLLGKSASAYEHLRRAISRGQLRPGRRLSATGLAEAFRISETPVREALLRLGTEGFLAWEPSRGHFTKAVTLDEQVDLHELIAINLNGCLQHVPADGRTSLEPLALAAAEIQQGRAVDRGDRGEDTVRLLGELGAALVARGGNQVLATVMSVMFDRTWLIRRLDVSAPEQLAQARQRFAGVALAVQADDVATAIAIIGQHFVDRRRRLPQLVDAANRVMAQATYP